MVTVAFRSQPARSSYFDTHKFTVLDNKNLPSPCHLLLPSAANTLSSESFIIGRSITRQPHHPSCATLKSPPLSQRPSRWHLLQICSRRYAACIVPSVQVTHLLTLFTSLSRSLQERKELRSIPRGASGRTSLGAFRADDLPDHGFLFPCILRLSSYGTTVWAH